MAMRRITIGQGLKAHDYYGKLLTLTLQVDSRSQEISEAREYLAQ
jgi:hypothetical protein